jgi:hypothetical protein
VNVQHSARTDLWFTPCYILEMARQVLGSIDLDPASDARANEDVKASAYITESQCGLSTPWRAGSVWLNPPGGKIGNRSRTGLFWERLMAHRSSGVMTHALFMAFSAEALQNTQGRAHPPMMAFPFCIPAKRIKFVSRGVEKCQPSHSNAIVYVPGTIDKTETFKDVFSSIGCVRV